MNKMECTCEEKGRTVWRISSDGICLKCGKQYLPRKPVMKLFQATLETVPNNCYMETVLVIAENKDDAHKQLVEKNGQWGVAYTKQLKEIEIDMTKPNVIKVDWGHGESDYGYDD
jgi:hypothetical protein